MLFVTGAIHQNISNRNYVYQMRVYEGYEGDTLCAGLSHMHGLRHAYAQNCYEELTGWNCPAVGGPDRKSLTPEQREADREARLTISQELGRERETVVSLSWSVASVLVAHIAISCLRGLNSNLSPQKYQAYL